MARRRPRRFEVHWVDVPENGTRGTEYRNSDSGGPRAWVVISEEQTQQAGIVIAVPLTTSQRPMSGYLVDVRAEDIIQVPGDDRTPVDAFACCDHIRALSVTRFRSRLGKLRPTLRGLIEEAVMRALGLPG